MQKTILVIEPDSYMRENLSEVLELANYNPLVVGNVDSGIALAKEHQPDVIFCELSEPSLIGITVADMLQKDKVTQHIPIVFLVARVDRKVLRDNTSKFADYITKPFAFEEIDITIQRLTRPYLT